MLTDAEYQRMRRGVRNLRWITPLWILISIGWVLQYQGYRAGDWRGDVAARVIFAGCMTACFLVVRASIIRRLRTAERDVHPITDKHRIAAVARRYLDDQVPLASPGVHQPPLVITMQATFARDASRLEPRVSSAEVAARPERTVWVVMVSGEVLNLRNLPWSRSGDSCPTGNLVIDDATSTVLGVYPHPLGT